MQSLLQCMQKDTAARCEAIVYGYIVGTSILLVFGTTGNVWTACIVTRGARRGTPTSALMLALAVVDTLALWVSPGRHLMRYAFGVDVQGLSSAGCKLQRFLLYFGMDASSGFMVALSADRFIAVCRPNLWKSFTLARARITIAALAAASALFNVHVFWTRGPAKTFIEQQNKTEEIICGFPVPTYGSLTQGWVALTYYVVVPFIVMAVLNFCVVWKLRAQRILFGKISSSSHSEARKRDEVMLTFMLLGASFFFLCVTTPASVYNTIESTLSAATKHRLRVVHAYMTILQYLNYSVNFYLYILISRRFRHDMLSSLRSLRCFRSLFFSQPPIALSENSQEYRATNSTSA